MEVSFELAKQISSLFLKVSPARNNIFATVSNNAGSDSCNQLDVYVKWEEKRAADRACGQAFLALDEHNANSCRGWRQPACRLLPGFSNQQCSCLISVCNQAGVKSDETKSFRECTLDQRADWYFTEQAAQASGFQELLNKVASCKKGTQGRSSYNSFSGGGSNGGEDTNIPNKRYGADLPIVATTQHDAGTTRVEAVGKGGKIFTCDICRSEYSSKYVLRSHRKKHTEDLQCKICQKQCSTPWNYKRHIKEVHQQSIAGTSREKHKGKEGKLYTCKICTSEFSTAFALRNHRKTHTEDLECKICRKQISSLSNFHSHIKNVHKGNAAAASGKDPERSKKFMDAYNSKKPHVCDVCGARYGAFRSLKWHKQSHTNSQSSTCTLCNRTYSSPSSLFWHMKQQH